MVGMNPSQSQQDIARELLAKATELYGAQRAEAIRATRVAVHETKTVMHDLNDRVSLATDVLGFVDRLRRGADSMLQIASGAATATWKVR